MVSRCSGGLAVRRAAAWSHVLGVKASSFTPSVVDCDVDEKLKFLNLYFQFFYILVIQLPVYVKMALSDTKFRP
jgi:hypothetical protein